MGPRYPMQSKQLPPERKDLDVFSNFVTRKSSLPEVRVSACIHIVLLRVVCRQLALKWHPDKAAGSPPTKAAADVVFKLLSAANAIFSDPGKRRQHDFIAARWKNQHAQHWKYSRTAPFTPGGMAPYCYHQTTPFGAQ